MTNGERIARLERAIAQDAYMRTGPYGLATLARQAPAVFELVRDWMTRTEPASDNTLVGRRETTEHHPAERR